MIFLKVLAKIVVYTLPITLSTFLIPVDIILSDGMQKSDDSDTREMMRSVYVILNGCGILIIMGTIAFDICRLINFAFS